MSTFYFLIALFMLEIVVNIHIRKKNCFLNSTYQLNKYKTLNIRRNYRIIKNRNNKLYVSLFDEYDEKCIKALIMAREVAKNDNEQEILLKHLLIAIIRIDSHLIESILKYFNISLTHFLDKFNMEINKIQNYSNNIHEQNIDNISYNVIPKNKTDEHVKKKDPLLHPYDTDSNGKRSIKDMINQNDGDKLMTNFIDKHIKDIENKIDLLKNLNENQSNISSTSSTAAHNADSPCGGTVTPNADCTNNVSSTENGIGYSDSSVASNDNNDSDGGSTDIVSCNITDQETHTSSSSKDSQGITNDITISKNKKDAKTWSGVNSDIKFSENCKLVLQNAVLEARKKKKMFVNVIDILTSLINMALEKKNCDFVKYLDELNISVHELKNQLTSYDENGSSSFPASSRSVSTNIGGNADNNSTGGSTGSSSDNSSGSDNSKNNSYKSFNLSSRDFDNQRISNMYNELRNNELRNNAQVNSGHANSEHPNNGQTNNGLANNGQQNNIMNSLNSEYLNQARDFKSNDENNFASNNKIITSSSFMKDCLIDMIQMAYEKGDEHFFGRKKEIKRIIEILGRKKKSNPLLIGESGVGKTAIIEHLSYLILKDQVPYHLRNCTIYQLNVGNIVAGTKYRGEFEEKMKHLLSNINKKKKNILFIDEIHVIVGAGSGEGSLDASNLLKPFLSSDNLQCIGTTTFQEYTKYIESDKALRRRFNCIPVRQFTSKETYRLLKKIKYSYEKYHNIYYTSDSLKSIVTLTEDYLPTLHFPDKAIDILDEAGAYQKIKYEKYMRQKLRHERFLPNKENTPTHSRVEEVEEVKEGEKQRSSEDKKESQNVSSDSHMTQEQNGNNSIITSNKDGIEKLTGTETNTQLNKANKFSKDQNVDNKNEEDELYLENMHMKYVTSDVIENIVSKKSSISYIKKNKKEEEKILKLKEKLNEIIIGQEKVIDILSKYLFKAITNIKDQNKPIGTLLLCGSSGVGKTLCAQVISKYLFNEDNLIVINMSEYIDKHSVSKLLGSYPGYIGYKEGGELTESVKKKPFSIILFDEIEKAHSEVLHVLLQILDSGVLNDSKGNKVSFKNTFIFMTTNVGSDIITDYFKLYNKNYANLGFKYYMKKKKNSVNANITSNKESLPDDINLTMAHDPTNENKEISNSSKNSTNDSFEIFDEKLRTNKWYDELQPEIEEELKKRFLPEFLNRIDEKIIFRQFLKTDIINILETMIDDLKKRIKKRKNLNLIIDKEVIKYICNDENNIYDMNFGARSIRRALYKYIEDPIASFLISNLYEPNDSIHVNLTSDNKTNVQLLKTSIKSLS
ncbi:ATP-dependent Clp protease, putative [Plasmodium malariae]|uniref:ATP-dependent Clp protease, putative n=1 Tax=Plasmodium malariae TaxID=5858 RepID=A0A1C3KFX4_PLAMA|nr:ATP-dependent Clp protease, putative [Plasmodium malariae]